MTASYCPVCRGEQFVDDEAPDGGSILVLCPRCKGSGQR